MRNRLRRLGTGLGAALSLFTLAACSVPPPTVGFYGNGTFTEARPAIWCEIESDLVITCPEEVSDVTAKVRLAPGQGVVVSVPTEVRDTAWAVVITYLDAAGEQQAARSAIYEAGTRLTHEIHMAEGEQLLEADVMSVTATLNEATGEMEYPYWRLWVLEVEPVTGAN